MSADDLDTQKRFKASLKAPYAFIADPEVKLIELYDVKMPVMTLASRTTFVIGKDRKIVAIDTGGDAIDPSRAISACSVAK